MESITTSSQLLNFRVVTVTDLNTIVKLYNQQKEESFSENQNLTKQFGLPLYVAEWDNEIVGYSYAAVSNSNDYCLKTHINTAFSNYSINENLILESELLFESEWKNSTNKGLTTAIDQLVKWLNNSKS